MPSAARQIQSDARAHVNASEFNQTQKKRQGTVVALQTKTFVFPKGALVAGVLVAFSMCFLMLYRFGMIAEMNMSLGKMNREYASLKESGRMMKVEIESSLQLDGIREQAEKQFGMHEPTTNQIIPVRVPKSTYSVISDPLYIQTLKNPGRNVMSRILDVFGAVVP